MSQAVTNWLEANADRAMDRQRAQADAAKIVATFIIGIATSVVASALQMNRAGASAYNKWASALLALSAILTAVVIVLDRISEADHKTLLVRAQIQGWGEARLLRELQEMTITASRDNQKVLHEVWIALLIQFLLATACAVTAAVGMLGF